MTRRAAPTPDARQLGFSFDPPPLARREADLAGLERTIAGAVSRILKEDPRSRPEVAGAMSSLLGDDSVSPLMLDAYASQARENHNISAGRFFALVAATNRFDVLDGLLRRVGAGVLVGEEWRVAQLGQLTAQVRQMQGKIRELQAQAQPIQRGGDPR